MEENKKLMNKKYKRAIGKHWTIEEMRAVAATCKNRGEFNTKHRSVYMRAYIRGVLDLVCADLPPSQKRRKFIKSYCDPSVLLGEIFKYKTLKELGLNDNGLYELARRQGIDMTELFDNIDNASYIKGVFSQILERNLEKLTEAK